MIPTPWRTKGAGPQLGARRPGERGPFGPYGGWNEADDQDDDGLDGSDSVGETD